MPRKNLYDYFNSVQDDIIDTKTKAKIIKEILDSNKENKEFILKYINNELEDNETQIKAKKLIRNLNKTYKNKVLKYITSEVNLKLIYDIFPSNKETLKAKQMKVDKFLKAKNISLSVAKNIESYLRGDLETLKKEKKVIEILLEDLINDYKNSWLDINLFYEYFGLTKDSKYKIYVDIIFENSKKQQEILNYFAGLTDLDENLQKYMYYLKNKYKLAITYNYFGKKYYLENIIINLGLDISWLTKEWSNISKEKRKNITKLLKIKEYNLRRKGINAFDAKLYILNTLHDIFIYNKNISLENGLLIFINEPHKEIFS